MGIDSQVTQLHSGGEMYRLEFVNEAAEDEHEEREEGTAPGDRDASSISMSEEDGSGMYFDYDALDRMENNPPYASQSSLIRDGCRERRRED
jgi:hypothetical protein